MLPMDDDSSSEAANIRSDMDGFTGVTRGYKRERGLTKALSVLRSSTKWQPQRRGSTSHLRIVDENELLEHDAEDDAVMEDSSRRRTGSGMALPSRSLNRQRGPSATASGEGQRRNTPRGEWSPAEEAVLARKHMELGNKWTTISQFLPARSDNDVKNIWHSTLRSKNSERRSFLRTYARAVRDCASDSEARRQAYEMAQKVCGPPQSIESALLAVQQQYQQQLANQQQDEEENGLTDGNSPENMPEAECDAALLPAGGDRQDMAQPAACCPALAELGPLAPAQPAATAPQEGTPLRVPAAGSCSRPTCSTPDSQQQQLGDAFPGNLLPSLTSGAGVGSGGACPGASANPLEALEPAAASPSHGSFPTACHHPLGAHHLQNHQQHHHLHHQATATAPPRGSLIPTRDSSHSLGHPFGPGEGSLQHPTPLPIHQPSSQPPGTAAPREVDSSCLARLSALQLADQRLLLRQQQQLQHQHHPPADHLARANASTSSTGCHHHYQHHCGAGGQLPLTAQQQQPTYGGSGAVSAAACGVTGAVAGRPSAGGRGGSGGGGELDDMLASMGLELGLEDVAGEGTRGQSPQPQAGGSGDGGGGEGCGSLQPGAPPGGDLGEQGANAPSQQQQPLSPGGGLAEGGGAATQQHPAGPPHSVGLHTVGGGSRVGDRLQPHHHHNRHHPHHHQHPGMPQPDALDSLLAELEARNRMPHLSAHPATHLGGSGGGGGGGGGGGRRPSGGDGCYSLQLPPELPLQPHDDVLGLNLGPPYYRCPPVPAFLEPQSLGSLSRCGLLAPHNTLLSELASPRGSCSSTVELLASGQHAFIDGSKPSPGVGCAGVGVGVVQPSGSLELARRGSALGMFGSGLGPGAAGGPGGGGADSFSNPSSGLMSPLGVGSAHTALASHQHRAATGNGAAAGSTAVGNQYGGPGLGGGSGVWHASAAGGWAAGAVRQAGGGSAADGSGTAAAGGASRTLSSPFGFGSEAAAASAATGGGGIMTGGRLAGFPSATAPTAPGGGGGGGAGSGFLNGRGSVGLGPSMSSLAVPAQVDVVTMGLDSGDLLDCLMDCGDGEGEGEADLGFGMGFGAAEAREQAEPVPAAAAAPSVSGGLMVSGGPSGDGGPSGCGGPQEEAHIDMMLRASSRAAMFQRHQQMQQQMHMQQQQQQMEFGVYGQGLLMVGMPQGGVASAAGGGQPFWSPSKVLSHSTSTLSNTARIGPLLRL